MNGHAVTSRRAWLRSRWLPTGLAVVPALLAVWAATPPGGYFDVGVWSFLGWLATGTLWIIVAMLTGFELPPPRRRHLGRLWPLLTFPVLLWGTLELLGSGLVSKVAFEVHRPGLERLVAEVAAAPGQQLRDQRVGLFDVGYASLDRSAGCTELDLTGAGADSMAFAYCPGPPPTDIREDSYRKTYQHINGAWYISSLSA